MKWDAVKDRKSGNMIFDSITNFGVYTITKTNEKIELFFHLSQMICLGNRFNSIDDAKEYASIDFKKRVKGL